MLRCSSSAPSLTTLAANYQPVDYDALSPAEQRDILQLQQSILESVVQEHDHRKVIESVCRLEEQLLPNAVATVMLLDHRRELNVYAAPSVPADKAAQLNGLKPGPHAGSCGNAVYREEPVFVSNTLEDPRWHDLRQVAINFGLMSCWSMPIRSAGNQIIGTFALSSFVSRSPSGFHRKILEIGASIIGIALEQRRQARTLNLLDKVFESSNQGILITDGSRRILSVNPAFSQITGYSAEESIGQRPSLLSSGRHAPAFYREMWQTLRRQGYWQGEVWNRRKNGEVFPEWLSISCVREGKEITHYVGFFFDISEQKAAEQRLQFLAYHDPLTELPNRLLLQERLTLASRQARRQGHRAALLFIDLDHFKNINDSMGQGIGDALLQAVATRLDRQLNNANTLARYGADEFLIVMPEIADPEQPAQLAEQILDDFVAPFLISGHELPATPSLGIAVFPDDGEDYDTLLKKAQSATFYAKQAGRNTYRFYTEAMNNNAAEHLRIYNGLRHALARQQFVLHYQPQVDLSNGRIIGAEALVRWNHPDKGLIPPASFIPVAEESGVIVQLGEWVLREACRQAAQWQQQGLPPLVMAVNLSGVEFKRGNLEQSVEQALADSGLPAPQLELELTESILIQDTANVLATVKRLKSQGIKLSIDDFGTGYSSLAYLTRLAVDKLKIDQSFVRHLVQEPENGPIVRAVIQMAHSLNLIAIAEGVEDSHARDFLLEHGCDEAQGYFYSRPLPADDFAALLAQQG
ncbi:MAG TPA: EAL domain-containing protein [Chromobacteriaceae bacterium]|nr:EAL domain-containing protein [Chromobacteriaceae bacterium]